MKNILFALASIIVLMNSYSCTESNPVYIYGNIAGKVTEEGSNKPIEGATIEISGIEQAVKTGSNGIFKFEKLPADNYTVYVSKDGYVADSKVITIVAAQTAQCDFSLQKNLPQAIPSEIQLNTTTSSASIELTNTRSVDMDFTIETSKSWITVSPTHGTIASKNTKIIKTSVDFSAIEYGDYTESVVINVGQSSLSIPIQISYYRPSYIEVTCPEPGKVYTMGEILPITWNSNIGGTVRIELYRNGTIQQTIVPSVDNYNSSIHNWGIPSLSIDAYQIRITSVQNPNIFRDTEVFYLQEGPTPPVVSTGVTTSITSYSVKVLSSLDDLGKTFNYVTQYGLVYSEENPNPTISDYKINHGTSSEIKHYISELTNLKPNTCYYIRAYAENPKGIAYGTTISATTKTADGKEPWQPTEPDENGAVDLGLSVKWAAYNIGATSPEEYGDYYAWGEVESKIDYTEKTYQFYRVDKYNYILPDGLSDISATKYDAATANWGNGWRMPTKLEIMELCEKTTIVYVNYNNVKGYRFIGPNGNSIFLPNAGYRDEYGLKGAGGAGQYWSSSVNESNKNCSYSMIPSNSNKVTDNYRSCGLSIRAVKD